MQVAKALLSQSFVVKFLDDLSSSFTFSPSFYPQYNQQKASPCLFTFPVIALNKLFFWAEGELFHITTWIEPKSINISRLLSAKSNFITHLALTRQTFALSLSLPPSTWNISNQTLFYVRNVQFSCEKTASWGRKMMESNLKAFSLEENLITRYAGALNQCGLKTIFICKRILKFRNVEKNISHKTSGKKSFQ